MANQEQPAASLAAQAAAQAAVGPGEAQGPVSAPLPQGTPEQVAQNAAASERPPTLPRPQITGASAPPPLVPHRVTGVPAQPEIDAAADSLLFAPTDRPNEDIRAGMANGMAAPPEGAAATWLPIISALAQDPYAPASMKAVYNQLVGGLEASR